MDDKFYTLIMRWIRAVIWEGKLLGAENLPREGAAVLVGNHLGARGPIGAVTTIPLRLYPWIVEEMLNMRDAPDYMRVDFIEKELKLRPPLSSALARLICVITVPLLRYLGCVPVYHDYEGLKRTFQKSLDLLLAKRTLLIFPEDPQQEQDPLTKMRPFQKGFVHIAELYFENTGLALKFYPIAIHQTHKVMVGTPIEHHPQAIPYRERPRVRSLLEQSIRHMYLEMSASPNLPLTIPHIRTTSDHK